MNKVLYIMIDNEKAYSWRLWIGPRSLCTISRWFEKPFSILTTYLFSLYSNTMSRVNLHRYNSQEKSSYVYEWRLHPHQTESGEIGKGRLIDGISFDGATWVRWFLSHYNTVTYFKYEVMSGMNLASTCVLKLGMSDTSPLSNNPFSLPFPSLNQECSKFVTFETINIPFLLICGSSPDRIRLTQATILFYLFMSPVSPTDAFWSINALRMPCNNCSSKDQPLNTMWKICIRIDFSFKKVRFWGYQTLT